MSRRLLPPQLKSRLFQCFLSWRHHHHGGPCPLSSLRIETHSSRTLCDLILALAWKSQAMASNARMRSLAWHSSSVCVHHNIAFAVPVPQKELFALSNVIMLSLSSRALLLDRCDVFRQCMCCCHHSVTSIGFPMPPDFVYRHLLFSPRTMNSRPCANSKILNGALASSGITTIRSAAFLKPRTFSRVELPRQLHRCVISKIAETRLCFSEKVFDA